MNRKPMLASDYDESKLKFPLLVQPKIDGVRGLNMEGTLTGRSLKQHKNRHVTQSFSWPEFIGFDGEMTLEGHSRHPDACRLTSSALGTITGEPDLEWWVFDYVTAETVTLAYAERYKVLAQQVYTLADHRVKLIPNWLVTSLAELEQADSYFLSQGYEGTILRDPSGKHKDGRSTPKEGGLLRIKRFVEEEGIVVSLTEGQENGNDATINELGRTERSSHQANMTPNGMVGTLEVRLVKDVQMGEKTLPAGTLCTVSAGTMPHADRLRYFQEPGLIVGKLVKFKYFPKGVKDKPRFPTFQSVKEDSDQ
jgi:DNA ligase-1